MLLLTQSTSFNREHDRLLSESSEVKWSEAILGKCEASKCYRGTPFPFWLKNKLRMGCNTSSEEWPHVSVFIGFDNCYQFHLAWGPRELQLLQRSRFTSNFLSLPSLLPMPRVGTVEIHRLDQWFLDLTIAVAGEADTCQLSVSFINHSSGPI